MRFSILALIGSLSISAQTAPKIAARLDTGYRAIQEATLRANLAFLASDALEGRLSLQPGDDVAAEWVASEFAKAGLKPATDGSFLQPVPLIEYRNDRSQSYVGLNRAGSEKQWKFPEAYSQVYLQRHRQHALRHYARESSECAGAWRDWRSHCG
jgi:hypothetical protein